MRDTPVLGGTREDTSTKFRDPQWGGTRLRSVSLLKPFTEEELAILYSHGVVRQISSGSHVVIEGEPSRGLYLVLRGTVSVHKNDPIKQSLYRIAMLEEGSHFGELSLFDTAPRSATVVAETACDLFFLDSKDFETFLRQGGQEAEVKFYKSCLEDLSSRVRQLNADYLQAQQMLWTHALRRDEKTTEPTA